MRRQVHSRSLRPRTPSCRYRLLIWVVAVLCGLISAGPAAAQLFVNKSFSPANVVPAQVSTLTIQILNNTTTVATGVSLTDTLPANPAGMKVGSGGLISNSCGGTVTATAGSTTVTLTGGTVAASVSGTAGSCLISVQVIATPNASASATVYTNVIPPANVSSSIGGSSSTVSATLSVAPVNALTGTITFAPGVIKGDGTASRMRITLTNPNSYALTSTAFTMTLQAQLARATTPNASTTCSGGAVDGSTTTITLAGATIAANGSCYIEVDIVARTPSGAQNGNVTTAIAAGGVTTEQKVTNAGTISGSVTVQTGATVAKAFAASVISAGQNTTLTITITNYRASTLGPFSLTDTLPTNLVTSGSGSTTCSGGSVATGSGAVTVSGATLAAAPAASAGGTSCTVTVPVTSNVDGNYTNTIAAGTIAGSSFSAASAILQVTSVRGTKSFTASSAPRTATTTLSIKLYNRNTASAASITAFTDNLTTMGSDITIASGTPTNGCGGTLTATVSGTQISLSGGSIPIAVSMASEGSCTITVPVAVARTATINTRTNTVAAGALQTSNGNNAVAFSANLSVTSPLAVATNFSAASVVAGRNVTLTVTISRATYAALMTGVALTDTLPNGFVVAPSPSASTTCSGGAVTATPGAGSFSLSGGSTGTVVTSASSCTVSLAIVAPGTTGSYTNTVAVGEASANTDQGAVANVAAASASINVTGSVSLNTAFSPTSISPGATSRLSVYISNPASLGPLSGVVLTDNLPSGLMIKSPANATLVASAGSCTGTIDATAGAGVLRITGGTVSAGAECELSVDVSTDSIGTLVNFVPANALTSSEGYSNRNTASATLVSTGAAEVSITNTNAVAHSTAGQSTTYTLVVSNNNTELAVTGLPVTFPEPTGLNYTSWTCTATSGSHCSNAAGTGAIANTVDVAPLGRATYQVVAKLASAYSVAQMTTTARVNPAGAGVSDPDSSNDVASDTDTVDRSADVAVAKVVSWATPRIGDTVTFTVTAANAGPSDAADVAVADALPSGYDLVSATPATGTWTSPNWTIGTLPAGTSSTLAVVAKVKPTGDRANTASIATSTTDPNPANNSVTVTPTVIGLSVAKISSVVSDPVNGMGRPKVMPGAVIEYRITIKNEADGAIDANSIVLTDVLPAQLCVIVASPAVTMIEGSNASALSFLASSDVSWSRQAGGGTPFTYTPSADGNGCDPLVTGIRIAPRGQIAAGSPSAPTSTTFVMRALIR